ncbi:MAG: DUF1345 domain-containing protein [Acidobacteriota bacterium]|nr:DUF1345 domain-containing protein [Acidobacteriota bacterium]
MNSEQTVGSGLRPEQEHEPRWPAAVALIAVGFMYWGLPEELSVGPRWLLLAIILVLLAPMAITHRSGRYRLNHLLALIVDAVLTLFVIGSLIFLVQGLPSHREAPGALLRSAAGLWLTNILVFALWYWRLDAGGPHAREYATGPIDSAFLFPQMTRPEARSGGDSWSPHFVDYLFLAFNTSTAFSPTDTAVLSRGAKLAMMAQALISLLILALLAARAVNIL